MHIAAYITGATIAGGVSKLVAKGIGWQNSILHCKYCQLLCWCFGAGRDQVLHVSNATLLEYQRWTVIQQEGETVTIIRAAEHKT